MEKVSIIIPVYNGADYMRYAIDSAINQTYPNIEVIVVNDGSTDNGKTDAIAKSYGNKIRYFKKQNGGVSSAINYGIKKMTGKYFSWLSHDDAYFPNKVEVQIDYIKEHHLENKKVILYSDYEIISDKSKHLATITANEKLANLNPEYALMRGLINGNSLLIPKKAWDEYGGLDTKLTCTQDYEKWFEMSKTYKLQYVPGILIKSRVHTRQVTNTNPNVRIEGNVLWLKMIKAITPARQKEMNGSKYAYYWYLANYLRNTPYDEAYAYCIECMSKLPKEKLTKETYRYESGKLFSKNPFMRLYRSAKHEGLKNAISRFIKKHLLNREDTSHYDKHKGDKNETPNQKS